MDENPADSGTEAAPPPPREPAAGATRTDALGASGVTGDTNAQPPPPPPRSSFFDVLRGMDVRRTPDRWIGGVAAGIAHRVGLDPLVIRAGFIVLGLFFGLGIALYILAWALIPDATETTHLERGLREGRFASIAILILAAVVVLGTVPWWDGGSLGSALFGLIVLVGIGYGLYRVWVNRPTPGAVGDHGYHAAYGPPAGSHEPPVGEGTPAAAGTSTGYPPPPPPSAMAAGATGGSPQQGQQVQGGQQFRPDQPPHAGQAGPPPPPDERGAYFATPPQPPVPPVPRRARRLSGGGGFAALTAGALLVIVGGLVWSADAIDLAGNPITVAWCAGLVLLGAVLLGLGLAGRRAGFVGFFAAIAAFAVLITAPLPAGLRWSGEAGQVGWAPTASTLEPSYEWGAGEVRLDLRELGPDDVPIDEIDVGLGVGELTIYVPEDLNVVVNSDIGAGAVSVREQTAGDGFDFSDGPRYGPGNDWRRSEEGGVNFTNSTAVGGRPADLDINAEIGLGQITIITEGQ